MPPAGGRIEVSGASLQVGFLLALCAVGVPIAVLLRFHQQPSATMVAPTTPRGNDRAERKGRPRAGNTDPIERSALFADSGDMD